MNLKELIKSVSREEVLAKAQQLYPEASAYQKELADTFDQLSEATPTFSYFDTNIEVKRLSGRVAVTNTHLGALSDLAAKRITVDKTITLSSEELAAYIVGQVALHDYDTQRYKDHLDDDFE